LTCQVETEFAFQHYHRDALALLDVLRHDKRLDRLEAAGHITRAPDPTDRRGVPIALTAEGRSLVDQTLAQHVANEQAILSGLTPTEQRQLADLMRKLRLTLPPAGEGDAPAGRRAKAGSRSQ
jgi:hypothetical protein